MSGDVITFYVLCALAVLGLTAYVVSLALADHRVTPEPSIGGGIADTQADNAPSRALTDEQVVALADYLQGTCQALYDGLLALFGEDFSEDDLTIEDCQALDEEVFCCEDCGWWYDSSEIDDEDRWLCAECMRAYDTDDIETERKLEY